jgi:CheY-like chemotaxis protein
MKARILIVDDREVNRQLMRASLEPFGYELAVCATASDALKQAHANHPDLIISDIHMDPTSGVLLCRYMKQDPALQQVPFLLFSASYPTATEIAEAHSAGAEWCLSRPVEPEDLIARVRTCLARRGADRDPL